MVTGRRELVEMPIKGLPMIVSPSRAHSVNVRWISYINNKVNILKHLFYNMNRWVRIYFGHVDCYLSSGLVHSEKEGMLLQQREEIIMFCVQKNISTLCTVCIKYSVLANSDISLNCDTWYYDIYSFNFHLKFDNNRVWSRHALHHEITLWIEVI